MAIKNLQTVAMCVANMRGVRVTGTESKGAMGLVVLLAPRSLPRLPQLGMYPIRTGPDAKLVADNAATAQAERTGRSACGAGILPRAVRARSASGTFLSGRSRSRFTSMHQKAMPGVASQSCWCGTQQAQG